MSNHGPVMPIWNCAGCGLPWPCRTRQQELRAAYVDAPVSLSLYLSSYLVMAMQDLPGTPAGLLHRRFMEWTREGQPREESWVRVARRSL
ncbi:hypothetical protein BDK92_2007 [Micromonospora pisi]|uniref:Flavin reductase n=1 Tax=Micromonospora pisi TaxID=589240 RepID=A0A495JG10_9ACTN|nr:hypothetical protein [Micromonospora pisi]RKR87715.1 hypothetical protein BDK92_2007 [Micromonospora pisi]